MARDRTLMVPGNHDRFSGEMIPRMRRSFLFEDVFERDSVYPKRLLFVRENLVIAFFLMNSTPVPDIQKVFRRRKMAQLVAGGYMPPRDVCSHESPGP